MRNDFNQFAVNPTNLDITRSRFPRPSKFLTTFNAGSLIPFYCDDLLPGDTVSIDTSLVCRMSTPIHPVMDNAYLDVYYFFVPYRLLWEHTKEFFGESQDAFAPEVEYEVPQIRLKGNGKGSIYHQMGIPLFDSSRSLEIAAFRPRAYALIWNEWFRDQNVSDPLVIPKTDSTVTVSAVIGNSEDWFDNGFDTMPTEWTFGIPLPVAKYHDLFTSALPLPQKGPAVTLPLAGDEIGLPVQTLTQRHGLGAAGLQLRSRSDTSPQGALGVVGSQLTTDGTDTDPFPSGQLTPVYPDNLYVAADQLNAVSVNTLRQAFALQRLFEKDARGGTRYREIIKSHFGVTSPDARMAVPEFLSGKRIPITMTQVVQTSSTDETSPQGNTAAFSLTQDKSSSFTYSATEHGVLMGVMCVRTDQTYAQGVDKSWLRKRRYDYYWPVFANLGEQPIYNKELYLNSTTVPDYEDDVFGYGEAWYDYRFKPNRVSGAFDPKYTQSLDVWHYANDFNSQPTLSPEFIYESKRNIDRTLAVTSAVEDQFIIDMYFDATYVRPMPMYSIPGLIDHH